MCCTLLDNLSANALRLCRRDAFKSRLPPARFTSSHLATWASLEPLLYPSQCLRGTFRASLVTESGRLCHRRHQSRGGDGDGLISKEKCDRTRKAQGSRRGTEVTRGEGRVGGLQFSNLFVLLRSLKGFLCNERVPFQEEHVVVVGGGVGGRGGLTEPRLAYRHLKSTKRESQPACRCSLFHQSFSSRC